MHERRAAVVVLALALVLTGCSSTPAASPDATPAPVPDAVADATPTPTPAVASTPPVTAAPAATTPAGAPQVGLSGAVVVLDPGHDGGNGSHGAQLGAQVPDGRGGTKACNTTGTSTDAGYPEHAFTFAVATETAQLLRARGVTVQLTRPDDAGVGPCVDQRAAIGNQARADVVVSIHGDGAPAGGHGFHVAYASPPLNPAQAGPSPGLARAVRDTLSAEGLTPSTYLGTGGLDPRADLAGLNLSTRPTVLVELANMRNAGDAAAVSSADGRARFARALADAVLGWLAGR